MSELPAGPRPRYDAARVPAGTSVLAHFPELGRVPALAQHGADAGDAVLRFVLLYCDRHSPLHERFGDLDAKKREALHLAGIAPTAPRYAALLAWQDPAAVAMARAYVRLQASTEYLIWFHGVESVAQTAEKISDPIAGDLAGPAGDADDADEEGSGWAGAPRATEPAAQVHRAYKIRHEMLAQLLVQGPQLDALGRRLFLNDEQLREAAQAQAQQLTPPAERRAAQRTFLPFTAR